MRKPRDILNYGSTAILLQWENRIDELINRSVHAYAKAVQTHPALVDVVAAYASLLLHFDPSKTNAYQLKEWVYALAVKMPAEPVTKLHRLPVVYGGDFGPDLKGVAQQLQLTEEEVVALHTSATYRVYQLGYQPGFAFLGITDERLEIPRHSSPRPKVAAGSVGLAGRQTGIYPYELPGGWQLIGRCPVAMWQAERQPSGLLQAGDQVSFYAISPEQWAANQAV